VPKADKVPSESELIRSITSPLNIFSTVACNTRVTWTIEYDGAGGTELPFVLNKAEGYATHIWNSVLAKPHRIRCAGICILLSIGDCRERSHNRDDESHGTQFQHDTALQFGWLRNNC
jgi:hypothetical protein